MIHNTAPGNHNRRFSQEEVEAILRRALERQGRDAAPGSLSMSELIETARELGIDPEIVVTAVRDHEAAAAMEQHRHMHLAHRKHFRLYLGSFVVVSIALVMINAMMGGVKWSVFLIATIGMALLFSRLRAMRRLMRQRALGV